MVSLTGLQPTLVLHGENIKLLSCFCAISYNRLFMTAQFIHKYLQQHVQRVHVFWCWLTSTETVLLSVKLVSESKFSPPPGQLVEKLIDSAVAAIVTVAVLMVVVRCHRISSQAQRQ